MITLEQLAQWMALPRETEQVEFKEAKNSFDYEKLLNYCAALANEGGGHLVLGVTNAPPRKVVGTAAFGNSDDIKAKITTKLRLRIEAFELDHPAGRVLIFAVPPRPLGQPMEVSGARWMRSGEQLVAMTNDQIKRIFDEAVPDFSASTAPDATLADLDPDCIARFRTLWQARGGQALPTDDAQALGDADLVAPDGGITLAALILLGTPQAIGRHLACAEVIFMYRQGEGELRVAQREEFHQGLLGFDERLLRLVDEKNTEHRYLDGLFERAIPTFNLDVFREALLNAISHRDYRNQGSVRIEAWPTRIRIASPGGFPPGVTPDNIWQKSEPRNRRLAQAMGRIGLVERSGFGADLMFREQLREGKAPPSFEGTDAHEVVVTIDGRVIDDGFRKFLTTATSDLGRSLETDELLVLDCARSERPVPMSLQRAVAGLVAGGVLERAAKRRVVIGRRYARQLGVAGAGTRQHGLDRETNKALIEQHLRRHPGSALAEVCGVLPSFSEAQVTTLLRALRREGRIHKTGRTKDSRWFPGPSGGAP